MTTPADLPFQEGQRVGFAADLVRSHFTVPAGSTGVVEYVDDHLLSVQMDEAIPGLEAFDNQVDFQRPEFGEALEALRVLADR